MDMLISILSFWGHLVTITGWRNVITIWRGYSIKVGFNLIYKKDKFSIFTTYDVYYMFTWKGYPQDMDWEHYNSKTLNA